MTWTSGKKLQGNIYTIEQVLGEGNFGITYLARNENDRRVIIKTLSDRAQQTSDFDKLQQDFLNDALRLARCQHPHIVRVEEIIQEGDLYCMVMEYIEGEDLASWVDERGMLAEAEALQYIEQIGVGLTVVHQQGLLHRDVKPHNVILSSSQAVLNQESLAAVLIDFSISPEVRSDCFAPIEQFDTEAKLGAYTDIYGLAATLYAILTGELPVAAPARAKNTPLLAPKQLNPEISDRVNQAILQGMAFQPHERPDSIETWLRSLYNDPVISPESSTTLSDQKSQTKTIFSRDFPWGLLAGAFLTCGCIGLALAQIFAPYWIWLLVLVCASIPQIAGYAIAIFASLAAGLMALNLIIEPSIDTLTKFPLLAIAVYFSEAAVWYSALAIIFCAFSNSVLQQLKKVFGKIHAFLILAVTSWLGIGLGRVLGSMFNS